MALLNFQSAHAISLIWDGSHGSSDAWTQKQNWNGAGNKAVPVAGDDLHFFGPARLTTNSNDIAAATSFIGLTFDAGAGAFTLNGNSITLAGNVVNNSTNVQTINLPLILSTATRTFNAASGDLVVSGSGTISGGFGLDKAGGSNLTLATANTYTGTTSIIAGTLFANNASGSGTGTGLVNVGASGRLGGSGTIAPTAGAGIISVSGVLAPGASIGSTGNLTLNLGSATGAATMNSGSSFQYELGAAGASLAAFGTSDLLTIAGAVANGFVFTGNNIDFQSTGAVGYYKLFDTSSNNANTWSGLTFNATSGVVSSGLTFSNLAGSLTGNLLVGTATNGGTTGDIYLQVVPEPGTVLLGGLGMLGLLLRRRRDA